MIEQPRETEFLIFDGDVALETRRCRVLQLRDGRPAALWWGLAFPILPGNRIDASGDAWSINDTRALDVPSKAFAVIDGESEAYALVPGTFMEVETVAGKLRQAGITVLRTGRYYGERIADVESDWFIRLAKAHADEDLSALLEPLIGQRSAHPVDAEIADPRARLLTAELLAARAREAGLQVEIARLRAAIAEGQPEAERQAAALRDALRDEQQRRFEAEQAAAIATAAAQNQPRPVPVPSGRIADEVQDVLAGLFPGVRMLRDSVAVITAEFASRLGVWRALGELIATGGIPRDWKKIHAAQGWWERHLINGRDNTGRIYVRKIAESRWDVLVSHKVEQPRDIAWLDRQ